MATPRSVISVCRQGDIIFCRVEGWGTMVHGHALRQYAEARLDEGACTLRIDLQQCDYMDSTFLGTLICLARKFGHRFPEGFGLVSPAPKCCELLAKMRLNTVLPVRTVEVVPQGGWTELPGNKDDVGAFQMCVVQAHQELAKVPGPTGERFQGVALALASDLEAKKGH
jgi:anti-anti-sigma regulatory factor